MRAASARAISSHRNPATQHGLERAIAWSRQCSAEFPFFLANHLPMMLVALASLGATDARLEAYCESITTRAGSCRFPADRRVTRDNWREFLASASAKATIVPSSRGSGAARRGACATYLPPLVPGIAASALHAFMRLAYATMTDSDEEVGAALGYWAATYLPLCAAQGRAPTTDDPAEVLAGM